MQLLRIAEALGFETKGLLGPDILSHQLNKTPQALFFLTQRCKLSVLPLYPPGGRTGGIANSDRLYIFDHTPNEKYRVSVVCMAAKVGIR
jgi:hypothetical protein